MEEKSSSPISKNLLNANAKSKLKGLFDEIDETKNKKAKINRKSGTNYVNKNLKTTKNEEDPSKYKTKPTKPDFSQQFIESGMIGINLNLHNSAQYKGLTNFGNICYSNVVMQCLIALKEFVTMLNSVFKQIEEEDNLEKDYPVLFNLVKIMNYYQGGKMNK